MSTCLHYIIRHWQRFHQKGPEHQVKEELFQLLYHDDQNALNDCLTTPPIQLKGW